jgi:nitrate reductase NapE component
MKNPDSNRIEISEKRREVHKIRRLLFIWIVIFLIVMVAVVVILMS